MVNWAIFWVCLVNCTRITGNPEVNRPVTLPFQGEVVPFSRLYPQSPIYVDGIGDRRGRKCPLFELRMQQALRGCCARGIGVMVQSESILSPTDL